MSKDASEPVSVIILEREFLVACTADERPGLIAAAHYLDSKMREMRNAARGAGLDRVAILAALNISHELLDARQQASTESTRLAEKLLALNTKLERAVATSIQ